MYESIIGLFRIEILWLGFFSVDLFGFEVVGKASVANGLFG